VLCVVTRNVMKPEAEHRKSTKGLFLTENVTRRPRPGKIYWDVVLSDGKQDRRLVGVLTQPFLPKDKRYLAVHLRNDYSGGASYTVKHWIGEASSWLVKQYKMGNSIEMNHA
jgi:hypothetical protein